MSATSDSCSVIPRAKALQGGQIGPHAVGVDVTVEGDGWKACAGDPVISARLGRILVKWVTLEDMHQDWIRIETR